MRRGSSLRRMRLPTRSSVLVMVVAIGLRSSLEGGFLDRVDDVLVARAAAEIAFQTVADFFLGGARVALQQLTGSHDHAGRTKAALEAVLVPEGLLHGGLVD